MSFRVTDSCQICGNSFLFYETNRGYWKNNQLYVSGWKALKDHLQQAKVNAKAMQSMYQFWQLSTLVWMVTLKLLGCHVDIPLIDMYEGHLERRSRPTHPCQGEGHTMYCYIWSPCSRRARSTTSQQTTKFTVIIVKPRVLEGNTVLL